MGFKPTTNRRANFDDIREIMDPAEVEFLAEKETVTVVPNFAQDKIYLIGVCSYKYEMVSAKRVKSSSALRLIRFGLTDFFTSHMLAIPIWFPDSRYDGAS